MNVVKSTIRVSYVLRPPRSRLFDSGCRQLETVFPRYNKQKPANLANISLWTLGSVILVQSALFFSVSAANSTTRTNDTRMDVARVDVVLLAT